MTNGAAGTLEAGLQEPWPTRALQREGVGVGMWIFLASEILFFSGLLITYAVYRSLHAEAFHVAAARTDIVYGAINTMILLTSSLAMTVALRAATAQLRQLAIGCLIATAALGFAFLAVKGLEYYGDYTKGLIPGAHFALAPPETQLFWMLYWVMTGVHAIHLTAGILIVLAVVILFERRIVPLQASTTEAVAIYWHFVDCVWLVLFPLLYLVGR